MTAHAIIPVFLPTLFLDTSNQNPTLLLADHEYLGTVKFGRSKGRDISRNSVSAILL